MTTPKDFVNLNVSGSLSVQLSTGNFIVSDYSQLSRTMFSNAMTIGSMVSSANIYNTIAGDYSGKNVVYSEYNRNNTIYISNNYTNSFYTNNVTSANKIGGIASSSDFKYISVVDNTTNGSIYTNNTYGNGAFIRSTGYTVSNASLTNISMSGNGQYQLASWVVNDISGNSTTGNYLSTNFGSAFNAVSMGSFGYTYTNTTGNYFGFNNNCSAISSSGQYQLVCAAGNTGYPDYAYISSNYGTNWTTANIGLVNFFSALDMSSDGKYQVMSSFVNPNRYIYLSSDYGSNWSTAFSDTSGNYISYLNISETGQYIFGGNYDSSHIYSNDYGTSWTLTPTSYIIYSGYMPKAATYLLDIPDTTNVYKYSPDYAKTNVNSDISTGNLNVNTLKTSSSSTFGGSLIPSANITYDLGSSTKRWKDIYLSGNTINLGGTPISTNTQGTIAFGSTVFSTTTSGNVETSIPGSLNANDLLKVGISNYTNKNTDTIVNGSTYLSGPLDTFTQRTSIFDNYQSVTSNYTSFGADSLIQQDYTGQKILYIQGTDANVNISNNYGTTFSPIAVTTGSVAINKGVMSYTSQYITVASNTIIYTSNTYGNVFTQRSSVPLGTFNTVKMSGNGIYQLAGYNISSFSGDTATTCGALLSSDYGQTFNAFTITSGNTTSTTGIFNINIGLNYTGQYQLALMGIKAYMSSNYGSNWNEINLSNGLTNLMDCDLSETGRYQVIVNGNTQVFTSNDYGVSWVNSFTFSSTNIKTATISASGQMIVVFAESGSQGIAYSSDYGKTWTQDTTVTNWGGNSATIYSNSISKNGKYIVGSTNFPSIQVNKVTHSLNTDSLKITGNVGIGTTSPLTSLTVGDGILQGKSTLTLTGATTNPENSSRPGMYHRDNVGLGVFSDYEMSFQVNGGSSLTDAVYIKTNGNVGIGENSPGSRLLVKNSTTSLSFSSLNNPNLHSIQDMGTNDFGGGQHGCQFEIARSSSTHALALGVLDNGTCVIQGKANGIGYFPISFQAISSHVAFGARSDNPPTTTSGANGVLQVFSESSGIRGDGAAFQATNETNNIINFVNNAGSVRGFIGGSGSSNVSYNTSSDKRLKENVQDMDLQKTLEKVLELNPCTFTWNSDNTQGFGFIAQDVYKIFPVLKPDISSYVDISASDYDEENPMRKDGTAYYYSLDYAKFTPYLVAGIKALKNENDTLKSELNSMKEFLEKKFPNEFPEQLRRNSI